MHQTHLLHLGLGNVGQEVVRQIVARPSNLQYCGVFSSKSGNFNTAGLPAARLLVPNRHDDPLEAIDCIKKPFVLIDTTASDTTLPLIHQALKRGGAVVMSNKKPLSGDQATWDELMQSGRVYFETTVGAGLPVISAIQSLLATGDTIEQIQGCFSGTLGYIFSQIGAGVIFSQAVITAQKQGFTEPDPRDDLSGMDVARKALILSRLLGRRLELADIKLVGLLSQDLASLNSEEFMQYLPQLDADYAARVRAASSHDNVLRFVATITPTTTRVGLEELPAASDIGSLQGPDNIVVIQTERYHDNPLVIKGPGAGVSVTAAGVFADILRAAGAQV